MDNDMFLFIIVLFLSIDVFMVIRSRYCLPDSIPLLLLLSRDFVPGYSRFARYCLPGKACSRIAPLLSPLGDESLGTGFLRLKLTVRNHSSPKGDKRGTLS